MFVRRGGNMEECKVFKNHPEVIEKIKGKMLNENQIIELSELFHTFGDSTRVKILNALFEHELCVCDITALCNITQSAISHQLRFLKQAKLIKSRKQGKEVFYSLADDHVITIMNQGIEHIGE